MHDKNKRILQLSHKVIVQNLQPDQIYSELYKIKGIGDLLEKVQNTSKYENRAAAVGVLLTGLQLFDDEAYEIFTNAATGMSHDIFQELIKNQGLAEEEANKIEARRQLLLGLHKAPPQSSTQSQTPLSTDSMRETNTHLLKEVGDEKKEQKEADSNHYTEEEYEKFKKFTLPVALKTHLTKNMMNLYDNLDESLKQIVFSMKSSGALTRLHKESIEAKTTGIEKVGKLVEIITASSVHTYVRFLEAVKASGDSQLSQIFAELRGKEYTLDQETILKLKLN